jgi:hypothetical protein
MQATHDRCRVHPEVTPPAGESHFPHATLQIQNRSPKLEQHGRPFAPGTPVLVHVLADFSM